MVNFMEKWIPEILYIEMKNRRMKLERAHRIGAPGSERYSCPMIVHLHNFVDRQRVMDTARQIWEVRFVENNLFFSGLFHGDKGNAVDLTRLGKGSRT